MFFWIDTSILWELICLLFNTLWPVCLSLFIFFNIISFSPQLVKQLMDLYTVDLHVVSSHIGVFPGRMLRGPSSFSLWLYKRALRHLRLWLGALQIDWRIMFLHHRKEILSLHGNPKRKYRCRRGTCENGWRLMY